MGDNGLFCLLPLLPSFNPLSLWDPGPTCCCPSLSDQIYQVPHLGQGWVLKTLCPVVLSEAPSLDPCSVPHLSVSPHLSEELIPPGPLLSCP